MRTRAWVMDVGAGRHVAAGTHHVVEYLLSPETIGLPLAPAHCPAVLIWREQIIPSVDLARLPPSGEPASGAWHGAVVLAYQEMPGTPMRYGALLVYAAPEERWVSNEMACPLPEESALFRYFTSACFAERERKVLVLDTNKLFSESLPWTPPPPEGEAEDTPEPLDATPATRTEPDTGCPTADHPQSPERGASADQWPPQTTEREPEPAEQITGDEASNDGGGVETDVSTDPVPTSSGQREPTQLQIPHETVPAMGESRGATVAETSSEAIRAHWRRQAKQIIKETLAAIHDEVNLSRVFLAVLARAGSSHLASYFLGVEAESPLRGFRFERQDSSLFARLAERPQYFWLCARNRERLKPFLPAEVRDSLGDSDFFAASVFVGSKLVGLCYGDEYPSTDGLDEFRYRRFKDICRSMAQRLRATATHPARMQSA